jgi:glycosyltransferase involved in cell wall biosynthesis
MHLAFVDIAYDYTADRPDGDTRLGGTTSAVCFLARALVQAGVACTFFNTIKEPQESHGITSRPLGELADALGNPDYSAFIFCGRWLEKMVRLARDNTKAPLIAWMQESMFDARAAPVTDAFDGIVFVSEWQRRVNQPHTRPHWRQAVLRNAMNPRMAELFANNRPILATKTQPPILLYAGHFQRGAFHLPPILDRLRLKQSNFSIEIFSEIHPIRDPATDGKYMEWLRGLPNVAHVGFVSQTELIHRMERATFFIAPNPWPETSCIALIEAMAAGLSVITTNRAALPETASGFARLVDIDDPDHVVRFDMAMPHEKFAAAISAAMDEGRANPERTEWKLRAQIDYFLKNYQWAQRVTPWVDFVGSLGRKS